MFDSVIFADWPRGLYLAKKLSEEGQKTAYVEIQPRIKNPFGLFLGESLKEEKEFLETLGFLFRQEGGFCLLSPQGVWPLQDMETMKSRLSALKNAANKHFSKDFEEDWLSYLSFNLTGKIFEYNNSKFSEKSLNLFSDYFLFEPSFKRMEQFYQNHHKISFHKARLEELSLKEDRFEIYTNKKPLTKDQFEISENKKLLKEDQFESTKTKKPSKENQFNISENKELSGENQFNISENKELSGENQFNISENKEPSKENQFNISENKKPSKENQFNISETKEPSKENQFKTAKTISWPLKENQTTGGKKTLTSQKFFWFSSSSPPFLTKTKSLKPCWQWESCFFKTDFMDYKNIIPAHFVLLKDIFSPWSHDNLLSVFHKEGQLEVWMRVSYKKNQKIFLQKAQRILESFFKGLAFQPIEKSSHKGSIIYGPEALEFKNFSFKNKFYIEDLNDFFHCDLVSEIQAERELFKSLIS